MENLTQIEIHEDLEWEKKDATGSVLN